MVTLMTAYRYIRFFNSWVGTYSILLDALLRNDAPAPQCCSGVVTFIAAYHYIKFFNSGVYAYLTLLAALLRNEAPVQESCS